MQFCLTSLLDLRSKPPIFLLRKKKGFGKREELHAWTTRAKEEIKQEGSGAVLRQGGPSGTRHPLAESLMLYMTPEGVDSVLLVKTA